MCSTRGRETPHLTNSTATTSWARYGLSKAAQAMVDLGYTRKFSTRWTSSLHGTYNHFLEHADFGEIGAQDQVLSNNYLAGMGERSVCHRQAQCRVRRESLEAHGKLLRGDVRLVCRPALQPQQLHGVCAGRLSADLAPQAHCGRTGDQGPWLQHVMSTAGRAER